MEGCSPSFRKLKQANWLSMTTAPKANKQILEIALTTECLQMSSWHQPYTSYTYRVIYVELERCVRGTKCTVKTKCNYYVGQCHVAESTNYTVLCLWFFRCSYQRLATISGNTVSQGLSGPWSAADHPWQSLHAHCPMWVEKLNWMGIITSHMTLILIIVLKEQQTFLQCVVFCHNLLAYWFDN